ncbi:hypothetical protein SKAU_G00375240 [Synaphobranchus kaupii]|uniref:Uncharacterized protein n=1 Tax=Synaphobranchus kaupii TaxID=118154 RepID=A0A9Q1EGT9_SYNKA|nr:hypothetical protein SKAU_G00375240 [Synaphobranchus kaupii]
MTRLFPVRQNCVSDLMPIMPEESGRVGSETHSSSSNRGTLCSAMRLQTPQRSPRWRPSSEAAPPSAVHLTRPLPLEPEDGRRHWHATARHWL